MHFQWKRGKLSCGSLFQLSSVQSLSSNIYCSRNVQISLKICNTKSKRIPSLADSYIKPPRKSNMGFPSSSGSNAIPLQSRRPRIDSWVGKIPWIRKWQPTPVFVPGEFRGQMSLEGYSPWGRKELDTPERLTHTKSNIHFHSKYM